MLSERIVDMMSRLIVIALAALFGFVLYGGLGTATLVAMVVLVMAVGLLLRHRPSHYETEGTQEGEER